MHALLQYCMHIIPEYASSKLILYASSMLMCILYHNRRVIKRLHAAQGLGGQELLAILMVVILVVVLLGEVEEE